MLNYLVGLSLVLNAVFGYAYYSETKVNNHLTSKIADREDTIVQLTELRAKDQATLRQHSRAISQSRQREALLRKEIEHVENRQFLDLVIPDRLRDSLCAHFGSCGTAEAGN